MNESELYERLVVLDDTGDYPRLLEESEAHPDTLEGRYFRTVALWRLGQTKAALENYDAADKEDIPAAWQCRWERLMGHIHWAQGDMDGAIRSYSLTADIAENAGLLEDLGHALNGLGLVLAESGDLHESLRLYLKAEEAYRREGSEQNKLNMGLIRNNIANIHFVRGDIQTGMRSYHEFLDLAIDGDNPLYQATAYLNLGNCHIRLNQHHEAEAHLVKALTLSKPLGDPTLTAAILDSLVTASRPMDNPEKAQEYLSELMEYDSAEDNAVVHAHRQYAEAFVLGSSNRGRDKFQALNILSDLIRASDAEFETLVESLYLTIDILLYEYKSSQDQEVMEELVGYLDRLFEIAESQHMYATFVDVILFKARLALVRRDFDQIDPLLSQAEGIVNEQKMTHYVAIVDKERKQLEKDLRDFQTKYANSSISSLLEKSKIEDYVNIWLR